MQQVYAFSATRPALETSHHMEFGVFNGSYPGQRAHFRKAGLDVNMNEWDQVTNPYDLQTTMG